MSLRVSTTQPPWATLSATEHYCFGVEPSERNRTRTKAVFVLMGQSIFVHSNRIRSTVPMKVNGKGQTSRSKPPQWIARAWFKKTSLPYQLWQSDNNSGCTKHDCQQRSKWRPAVGRGCTLWVLSVAYIYVAQVRRKNAT